MSTVDKNIVLFDGVCNFCNSSVNFIIERDNRNCFKFASLQSDSGKKLLNRFGLDSENLKTIILVEGGKYYTRTTAALRIAKELRGAWKLFYVFIIIPPFIRNISYNIISKYRYRWFGKRNTCRIPTPEEKEKFLKD